MTSGLFDAADAGRTILAPTAELATALFDRVQRSHVAAGDAVWPTPRIRDFNGWVREQYAVRQFSDARLPRLLSDIEERELWREVILESTAAAEFLEPNGAARSARRARRAMAEYGIPLTALAQSGTEEAQALILWIQRFEERCLQLHCIASDRLLEIGAPDSPDIFCIESPTWRPVAHRWLERQRAVMLYPVMSAAGAASRCRAESPQIELAAMASWARDQLQSEPLFRGWICVPDMSRRRADVLDALDAALAPQRFSLGARDVAAPYAVAGGTPLADFAPVQAALTMLDAVTGSLSFEAFSVLLRMPELQDSEAAASEAAVLDAELRNRAPDAATLTEWLRMSEQALHAQPATPIAALGRLQDFQRTLLAASGEHPLSWWVPVWVAAFDSAPWSLRQRWSSSEYQAAERFRELLTALAAADDIFGSRSAASAARVLSRAARETAFQPQTGIPPIWVSSQLMDPWLDYDGLWIAGCAEDRWPPPLDPIPLLPVRLQREHGIVAANADLQLQFAVDLQRRWQSRAEHCIFSCVGASDGISRSFSPLLPDTLPMAEAAPADRPHWRMLAEQGPTLDSLIDESAPPFASVERVRGVGTLRAQSRCPFRGFAETRLTADKLTRPLPGFSTSERGTMTHHALEYFWSAVGSSERLKAMAPAPLDHWVGQCVVRAIGAQCRRRNPGSRWQIREALRMQALLHKWLEAELGRQAFRVEAVEQAQDSARFGGIAFSVRIDRIDRLADGSRVLIDYKTGMATPDWAGERPKNPQLPIYAILQPADLIAVAYGKVSASECGFVAEAGRENIFKANGRRSTLEGRPDFASLVNVWSERVEAVAAEFAAGTSTVAPLPGVCQSCGLQPLCRVSSSAADEAEVADV